MQNWFDGNKKIVLKELVIKRTRAGLNVATDVIAVEDKDSIVAETYGNVIAVKAGNEEREDIQILLKTLGSDKIKQFINDTYKGAVVPKF